MAAVRDLIAVDIGNSRLKLGRFRPNSTRPMTLPAPDAEFTLPIVNRTGDFDADRLRTWCDEHAHQRSQFLVASVHRSATKRLMATVAEWSEQAQRDVAVQTLSYRNVALTTSVGEPQQVGIDRLLSAFAASRVRQGDTPTVIVSLGTAITVDLLEADGVFAGGAILPGIAMSARALADDTDALPHVNPEQLQRPPALGKSTTAAIESGLYWGAIGAIRELVSQLSATQATSPQLFLTGGASRQVVDELANVVDIPVHHVPHLVLAGIALVDAATAGNSDD